MADFDIQRNNRTVVDITGNRVDASFSPTAGSNIAVVYIEPNSGNDAAILSKLAEIQNLSKGYAKKVWLAEALDSKVPRVDIRVIVRDDIED